MDDKRLTSLEARLLKLIESQRFSWKRVRALYSALCQAHLEVEDAALFPRLGTAIFVLDKHCMISRDMNESEVLFHMEPNAPIYL
jgi:hypothetical protein